jgi:hypothetical protein
MKASLHVGNQQAEMLVPNFIVDMARCQFGSRF